MVTGPGVNNLILLFILWFYSLTINFSTIENQLNMPYLIILIIIAVLVQEYIAAISCFQGSIITFWATNEFRISDTRFIPSIYNLGWSSIICLRSRVRPFYNTHIKQETLNHIGNFCIE